jgi:acetyl-CoA carboxylase carboxyltransferase component
MNLEGAVRLGMRKQLAAIEDDDAREQMLKGLIAIAYERGKAMNMASLLELDAVIDPADTRSFIVRALQSVPPPAQEPRRRFIDTW